MSLRDEISPKIKPGDDFYNYVNQKWRDNNPIPDDKARYDSFTVLTDENMERLHALLERPARSNQATNLKRLRDFYHAAMDEAAIAKAGLSPIQPQLAEIDKLEGAAAIVDFLGQRQARGMGLVWHLEIEPDDKDSSRYLLRFSQAGLGLPDRDYYFEKGERFDLIRQQYQKFLTDLFKLLHSPNPKKQADQVFDLETELAKASKTATELRDADAMYNLYSLKQLKAELAAIDWPDYFQKIGLTGVKEVVISQPEFIKRALELLSEKPTATWQSYLTFHSLAPLLSKLPP